MKNLLNYGIENVHYKKVSDNVIELIDPDNSGYNQVMDGNLETSLKTT